MTVLLYLRDSYVQDFTATVVRSLDDGVVLDRTAFYPGGGGQPRDEGALSSEGGPPVVVTGLRRDGADLVHELPSTFPEGASVSGALDWGARYALMRTHTAMHILCGVVWRDYGAHVTGGNMQPGRGRLDFELEHLDQALVAEIERRINAEVAAARPVRVAFLSREEAERVPDLVRTKVNLIPANVTEIRTIEIVGLDLQADGGTHVANTTEVGPLRVLDSMSKGKSNKRIVVGLDIPAPRG